MKQLYSTEILYLIDKVLKNIPLNNKPDLLYESDNFKLLYLKSSKIKISAEALDQIKVFLYDILKNISIIMKSENDLDLKIITINNLLLKNFLNYKVMVNVKNSIYYPLIYILKFLYELKNVQLNKNEIFQTNYETIMYLDRKINIKYLKINSNQIEKYIIIDHENEDLFFNNELFKFLNIYLNTNSVKYYNDTDYINKLIFELNLGEEFKILFNELLK